MMALFSTFETSSWSSYPLKQHWLFFAWKFTTIISVTFKWTSFATIDTIVLVWGYIGFTSIILFIITISMIIIARDLVFIINTSRCCVIKLEILAIFATVVWNVRNIVLASIQLIVFFQTSPSITTFITVIKMIFVICIEVNAEYLRVIVRIYTLRFVLIARTLSIFTYRITSWTCPFTSSAIL